MLNPAVIENLAKVDPDRYRAALFADPSARNKLQTVYAFHAELAKVPELVSEPMIGAIRYQWWREAIDEIYNDKAVRPHEITTPLADLLSSRQISRFWVDRLIDGRARDLDPTPFESLADAQTYCEDTSGMLALISAATVTNAFDDKDIKAAGTFWGMVGLLRAWGYYHDSMLSEIAYGDLLSETQEQYQSVRANLGKLSSDLFPAIGYVSLVPGFLKRLSTPSFDPTKQVVNYPQYRKQIRLMRAAFLGKI